MRKMLVTINGPPYEALREMALRRGMTIQAILRSMVIPQWLEDQAGLTASRETVSDISSSGSSSRGVLEKNL
jgi:hypothetical protein